MRPRQGWDHHRCDMVRWVMCGCISTCLVAGGGQWELLELVECTIMVTDNVIVNG